MDRREGKRRTAQAKAAYIESPEGFPAGGGGTVEATIQRCVRSKADRCLGCDALCGSSADELQKQEGRVRRAFKEATDAIEAAKGKQEEETADRQLWRWIGEFIEKPRWARAAAGGERRE